ncbi:MAG: dinitrogenase iron-molybdenum cofactor biosynthesis protein [Acetatifactor sp.]
MKIAVTYENGDVFQHFGHTQQFKVYEVRDGKVADMRIVSTEGSGHGALAGMLAGLGVDTLICGGIGGGAQAALAEMGIRFFGGVSGNADEAVNALLAGNLVFERDIRCDHHDHHGESHSCGEHGHGCAGNGGSCHQV